MPFRCFSAVKGSPRGASRSCADRNRVSSGELLANVRVLQQVVMLARKIEAVVALPFQRIGRRGQRLLVLHFDDRQRFEAQLGVLAQDVEVIDRVAEMIGIGIELGARVGRDLEIAQRLASLRSAAACEAPSRSRAPAQSSGNA